MLQKERRLGGGEETQDKRTEHVRGSELTKGGQRSAVLEIWRRTKEKKNLRERGESDHIQEITQDAQMGREHLGKDASSSERCWVSGPFWLLFSRPHPLGRPTPRYYSSYSVSPEIQALYLTCLLACIRILDGSVGWWGPMDLEEFWLCYIEAGRLPDVLKPQFSHP